MDSRQPVHMWQRRVSKHDALRYFCEFEEDIKIEEIIFVFMRIKKEE
jgi:hypothetical protein